MNTDQAKTLSDTALTRLMEALERGHSEALKSYLAVMSRFHRYSWNNALLIYMQRPNATHVAGFHAWLRMRRHVRKGEKGIAILAPMVGRKKSIDGEVLEDEQTQLYGFKVAHVWDLLQTDGEPIAEFAKVSGDPENATERLKAFLATKSIALEYDERIRPASGLSSGGKITLLPGLSGAEEFSVLVHECAHELLHRGERRSQTNHAGRETEAEAVAFVVSTAIGLDPGSSSSDYIQLHSGDKATLAESLGFVQRTAAEILNAVLPQEVAAA
ncbi:MAG: ArdC family protein, partial [Bryobacteraceae bacterium]